MEKKTEFTKCETENSFFSPSPVDGFWEFFESPRNILLQSLLIDISQAPFLSFPIAFFFKRIFQLCQETISVSRGLHSEECLLRVCRGIEFTENYLAWLVAFH